MHLNRLFWLKHNKLYELTGLPLQTPEVSRSECFIVNKIKKYILYLVESIAKVIWGDHMFIQGLFGSPCVGKLFFFCMNCTKGMSLVQFYL